MKENLTYCPLDFAWIIGKPKSSLTLGMGYYSRVAANNTNLKKVYISLDKRILLFLHMVHCRASFDVCLKMSEDS